MRCLQHMRLFIRKSAKAIEIAAIFSLFSIGVSNATIEDRDSVPAKSFYEDHARGWFWYEDPESEQLEARHENKNTEQISYPATEELKEYQAQLEEAKAAAVMHPTPQNVFNYQRMQYEMAEKSGKFAEVWMRNVYQNPRVDYTQVSPTSQNARHIYLEEQRKQTEGKIHKLSKEYGLFFFFKNDCHYCDAFAPVVKGFSEKYDWNVLAISKFGETHAIFERSVKDNGLAEDWGVNTYPSLFAVNPKTGHVIPVAVGMISIQEIEERIILIAGDGDKHE